MDLAAIIERYRGVIVTVVTTNSAAPVAIGEVLDGAILPNTLALKLTSTYDGSPVGATVFFNALQIVSIS